ncbi:hypothetical protein Bca4012_058504 [Brassica carinata]
MKDKRISTGNDLGTRAKHPRRPGNNAYYRGRFSRSPPTSGVEWRPINRTRESEASHGLLKKRNVTDEPSRRSGEKAHEEETAGRNTSETRGLEPEPKSREDEELDNIINEYANTADLAMTEDMTNDDDLLDEDLETKHSTRDKDMEDERIEAISQLSRSLPPPDQIRLQRRQKKWKHRQRAAHSPDLKGAEASKKLASRERKSPKSNAKALTRSISTFGLQHLIGILVLIYEQGMTLNVDYLEALLIPVGSKLSRSVSVKESCIPIFRSRWGRKVTNPSPPLPEDLRIVRNLLRGADLPVEEEFEPSLDEFVPYDIPVERERSRYPKDKHVAVDGNNGVVGGLECPTDELFRNFLNSQASGSGASRLAERTAQFKAKTAEKEISQLKEEVSANLFVRKGCCEGSS